MSLFPKIQSPCPYKGKFSDIMQGNECRLCKRAVIDLTDMSDGERKDFLSSCDTEVCVSYRVGAKSALAAMAMSTVAVSTSAAAQDTDNADLSDDWVEEHPENNFIIVGGMRKPDQVEWQLDKPAQTIAAKDLEEAAVDAESSPDLIFVVAGGMRKPDEAAWVADAPSKTTEDKPSLPIEYDDEPDSDMDTGENLPAD